MSDLISRKEAIDALNKLDVSDGVGISSIACDVQESAIIAIQHLPSAQPEKETCKDCKWEYSFGYGECHHCKRRFEDMWEEKDDG